MRLSAPIHRLKRRARLLSRQEGIPLGVALDRIARAEGFARWSLLAARAEEASPAPRILAAVEDGDLLLLAARPGQGKTVLGLQLLIEAAAEGRGAVFFTFEYTEAEAARRIRDLGGDPARIDITASDDICADLVAAHLADAPRGTVAVIDYLQILDQRRETPALAEQVAALRRTAQARGAVVACISQVDRRFDPALSPLPGLSDIRLPNPVDLTLFSKACFLHEGEARMQATA